MPLLTLILAKFAPAYTKNTHMCDKTEHNEHLRAVDVLKLIMAYAVILIHSFTVGTGAEAPGFLFFLLQLTVLLFFVTSGYLLSCKLSTNHPQRQTFTGSRYTRRYLRMFLYWAANPTSDSAAYFNQTPATRNVNPK